MGNLLVKKVVCGALLVLPDGRWVLQRRTEDAPTDPNGLTFFGGKIEKGETTEQGFRREIEEETDLDLEKNPYSLALKFKIEHYGKLLQVSLFRINIPRADFAVYEGTGAEAFTMSDLAKRTDISIVVSKAIELITEKTHGT